MALLFRLVLDLLMALCVKSAALEKVFKKPHMMPTF
ncbi:hypothetical protein H310_05467 [Aphanomyces invadans]|uniref:Uncharacterized protein n=1 Tax=Aphanomyces invadans TaxID=157072 RepID=A0A024U9E3_9STRA|nr:hypothetical protein H310_05467 [Aphanomyces invadans]ETW03036.1 hypothetical protein H310_05467 [Aphanomyces invadans]|eukprot:XP_008868420.1 hypothetical protein H310_05467 [Aphanomyces invadans]